MSCEYQIFHASLFLTNISDLVSFEAALLGKCLSAVVADDAKVKVIF